MSKRCHRRGFFQQAGLGAAATWAVAGKSAPAIEPVQRHSGPRFKFSLAAYSYRSLLSGKDPELTLTDFIDDCARFQLEGTELTSYYFPETITTDYLRELKRHCFRLGLSISGTAIRNDFGYPAGPEREREIAHCKQWIDYAEIMGAPVIRIFAGHVKPDTTPEESHRRIVTGLEECCAYAGQHGIHLALENHGGPTATVEGLLALVRDVDSPWLGVNLDTGNFHSDDVYGDLAKAAPYALNVQIKAVVSNSKKQKQPADFDRLATIMRDADYRGFVVLEYEESEDPRQACPSYLESLRAAFDRLPS